MKYKKILIKISGELLADKINNSILSIEKLNIIASIIKICSEKNINVCIVVGAGNIWRGKQFSHQMKIDQTTSDHVGMLSTIINAVALKNIIETKNKLKCVIMTTNIETRNIAEDYVFSKAINYLNEKKIVIFAGGIGNPYFTTDTTAVIRAIEMNVQAIFMIKNNINGVYNDDPNKNKNAHLIKKITFQEILDKKLNVMDLTAMTLLIVNNKKINIHVLSLSLKSFIKILDNNDNNIDGTLISLN